MRQSLAIALSAHIQGGRPVDADGSFLDEHVALSLGLGDIADTLGLRRCTVTRAFIDGDAETLRRLLYPEPVRHATRLLVETEHRHSQIATLAGFKSVMALNLALWFAVGADAGTYRRLNRPREATGHLRQAG